MNDYEFKMGCVIAAALVSAVLILIGGGFLYNAHKNRLMADAIRAGSEPLAVACAIDGDTQACYVVAGAKSACKP